MAKQAAGNVRFEEKDVTAPCLLFLPAHSRWGRPVSWSCTLGHAANLSKDTWRQSGRLPSNSHLLSGVFHAGDGYNQSSPGHGHTGGRL